MISRISWILTNQEESHQRSKFYFKYLQGVKEKHQVDASIADSEFHLVLLKYHGLYVEHPATLLKRRACCIPDEKFIFCFSALQHTDVKASVLKAEDEL